jgi:hypothetical protein
MIKYTAGQTEGHVARNRFGLGSIPVLIGLLVVPNAGTWLLMKVLASALHPDSQAIPSVTRPEPSPQWIEAVNRARRSIRGQPRRAEPARLIGSGWRGRQHCADRRRRLAAHRDAHARHSGYPVRDAAAVDGARGGFGDRLRRRRATVPSPLRAARGSAGALRTIQAPSPRRRRTRNGWASRARTRRSTRSYTT